MSIYVIGDLHLSFSTDKPMDIFGSNWDNHEQKIKEDWENKVTDDDLVLLTGDISWALKLEEATEDLKWIDALPGRKIIIKGNHDYWWSSLSKMNDLFDSIEFIHNNYYQYKDYAICGSRGWICPNDNQFDEHDEKIYDREVGRLRRSIEMATKDGFDQIIVMMHYPPTNDSFEASKFTQLFEDYGIDQVVYGHLHTQESFKAGLQGEVNGVEYLLTSCDYLDFKVKKIV